jgi:AraC-like DNA-binding protein
MITAMAATDRLGEILGLVESSLADPDLDGQALADRAYLTRFHFDRLVKAALGEPPGAFRRRLLLERAAHQLATADDGVLAVAVEAGYSSAEAFTRAFGRHYGKTPTAYRRSRATRHDIASPNHIHFHPPGGLRLPGTRRSNGMDVITRMLDHHLDLVGEIIDRTGQVDDTVLDQPIELSVEGIDRDPTLRTVVDRLVSQLEMWLQATAGQSATPNPGPATPEAMKARLATAGPKFRELAIGALDAGRADDTFIDATCDPPQTFTYGGMLAHVLTFSAVRRTIAIGALESAGIADLGSGDPMGYVGGSGDDASTITRRTT